MILYKVVTVTTSGDIENFQTVTYLGANSLTLTMPSFNLININQNTKFTVVVPPGITGTVLNTVDGNLFDPTSATTLSLTASGQYDLVINNGRWFVQLYAVGSSGGGITELTGNVTAGPGSGSQVATIANNAVTYAKIQQASAYKFLANNTNVAANLAENDFRDEGESPITATITFTGTTAPSGASTLSQWFTRIGNTVFYKFMQTYANASTATTGLTILFPTEFPAPFVPTGLNLSSSFLYMMEYSRFTTTPSGALTNTANCSLRRNAGNTDNEFVVSISSGNYRTFHMGGSYRCT